MANIFLSETAFISVDAQVGVQAPFFGPSRSNPSFESNMRKLFSAFRSTPAHIAHAQHQSTNKSSPLHIDNDGHRHADYAKPVGSEPVFPKNVNSAFIGTDLERWLRDRKVRRIVVVGLVTDHCVGTTVRMAANLGIVKEGDYADQSIQDGEVVCVGDATACFAKGGYDADTIHKVTLASLDGEFCRIATTDGLLEEMKAWS